MKEIGIRYERIAKLVTIINKHNLITPHSMDPCYMDPISLHDYHCYVDPMSLRDYHCYVDPITCTCLPLLYRHDLTYLIDLDV